MNVTMTSIISGKESSLDINITADQLERIENRRETGEHIQTIVPDLPADQREFLISGITPEEWNAQFGWVGDQGDGEADPEIRKYIDNLGAS